MGAEYSFTFSAGNRDFQFDLVPAEESKQAVTLNGIPYAVVVKDSQDLPVIQKLIQNALSKSAASLQDFEGRFKALADVHKVQVHATRKVQDIAVVKAATAQTAAAVHAVAKSLIPAPQYGERIITEREFTGASESPFTCEEVQTKIAEDVTRFIEGIDFNPLHFIKDFLLHYESAKSANPAITAEDAFTSFRPDSTNQALQQHGATCVGRSIDILQLLKQKYGLTGHVVVETLGPEAPPTHAAAIIPCKDGIVFIDVMFAEPVCTIKYSLGGAEVTQKMSIEDRAHYSFELVTVPGDLSTKDVILHKREVIVAKGQSQTSQKQILLRRLQSADQPVMKKFMLNSDSYPVYNGSSHLLIVYVKDQKIRCQVGRGATAARPELPFSAFNVEARSIDRSSLPLEQRELFLTEKFFSEFKTNPQVMLDEIFLMIKHYETLKSLFASAGKPF